MTIDIKKLRPWDEVTVMSPRFSAHGKYVVVEVVSPWIRVRPAASPSSTTQDSKVLLADIKAHYAAAQTDGDLPAGFPFSYEPPPAVKVEPVAEPEVEPEFVTIEVVGGPPDKELAIARTTRKGGQALMVSYMPDDAWIVDGQWHKRYLVDKRDADKFRRGVDGVVVRAGEV